MHYVALSVALVKNAEQTLSITLLETIELTSFLALRAWIESDLISFTLFKIV
jgi:hypothetical protein